MLRFVTRSSEVTADPGQSLPGRGAYVHLREACVERAVKRGGLARALKASAPVLFELEGFLSQAQGKR